MKQDQDMRDYIFIGSIFLQNTVFHYFYDTVCYFSDNFYQNILPHGCSEVFSNKNKYQISSQKITCVFLCSIFSQVSKNNFKILFNSSVQRVESRKAGTLNQFILTYFFDFIFFQF
jgi:hypothetical protein